MRSGLIWLRAVRGGRRSVPCAELSLRFEPLEERRLLTAVRNLDGFLENALLRGDDVSSELVSVGFSLDYFGATYEALFVNTNGNVSFGDNFTSGSPGSFGDVSLPIIAPFWADVDTRNLDSGAITYGSDQIDGRAAFGVNWIDVGYFAQQADLTNSFQLVLIDRSDVSLGAFDIEFNYDTILWDQGQTAAGKGGSEAVARAGFTAGTGAVASAYELIGSGIDDAFLDGDSIFSLAAGSLNSDVAGRYLFEVRGGTMLNALGLAGQAIEVEPGLFFLGRGVHPHDLEVNKPDNVNAADTTNADQIRGGVPGLGVTGAGLTVGVWEAGGYVRDTHEELAGRVTFGDTVMPNFTNHATHVAGTIAASGITPGVQGMAPEVNIISYSSDDDFAEMAAAAGVIIASNHSYGVDYGWDGSLPNTWLGDRALGTEDPRFGKYNSQARNLDLTIAANPSLVSFWSAGNQRNDALSPGATQYDTFFSIAPAGGVDLNDGWWRVPDSGATVAPPSDGNGGTGFDSLGGTKTAKNVLVIGAIQDVTQDPYPPLGNNILTDFSSFGPTDDGRIKPDLVANGQDLLSSGAASDTHTFVSSGTSMAAPNATGSAVLVMEHYRNLLGSLPNAATTKTLLIHNAHDIGNTGPDYRSGWGLLDAAATAQFITELVTPAPGRTRQLVQSIYVGVQQNFNVNVSAGQPLKVTIVWTDPAGAALPNGIGDELDPTTRALVNDLDLSIQGPGGEIFFPWTLDRDNPNAPAVRTVRNEVDNVEQVLIDFPVSGVYTIRVSHTGAITGGVQAFAMAISAGLLEPDAFEPNNTIATATRLGSERTTILRDLSIHIPTDVDFFRITAHETGKIIARALFNQVDGDLNMRVYDRQGNDITPPGQGVGVLDDETLIFPVVAQQDYYVMVFSGGGQTNTYALEIENFAVPRPAAVILHPQDDNGISNLDNVTDVDSPRIFIQTDLTEFIAGPTPGSPLPILSPAEAALAESAGLAVEVFVNGLSVGFANQAFAGSTTLFEFTLLSSMLAGLLPIDGGFLNLVSAAVRVFDGQQDGAGDPAPASGRSQLSPPLQLRWVDTHGPQITGVSITGSPHDLFNPKAVINSPTPLIDSLSITVRDLVARGAAFTHPALAAPVASVEPNDSIFGAQNLDRYFNLAQDPNIGDQTQNTSTLIPHATVLGTSNGTFDYYSFTVDVAGSKAIFDIDGAELGGVQADTAIFLYNAAGMLLASNDNANPNFGAGGSTSNLDSYLEFTFATPGVYTIGVARSGAVGAPGGITGNTLLPGTTYALHVSVENHAVAMQPGHFQLVGDHRGPAAISRVEFVPDPIVNGQPATGTIVIEFAQPLPDDRYTLTIFDSLTDVAGNKLDGESNASEPQGAPQFPSGDGVPGGNFVARFTVDSRPEIGVYIGTTIIVDINGNGVFDPNNPDVTNRDLVFEFGTISDQRLAGKFSPTLLPGFDVFVAYGRESAGAPFRFLIDINGNGRVDPGETFPAPQINGLAVAANFNPALAGDELAIFDGRQWHILYDGVGGPVTTLDSNLRGYPIAGDFNGDGIADLGTFQNNVFYLSYGPFAGAVNVSETIHFGMPGVGDRPVAADMDGDGITDLGLWVPDAGAGQGTGEWRFLISSDPAGLNHAFSPAPLGHDLAFRFGDPRALPIVGNFDPPVAYESNPNAARAAVTGLYHTILGRAPDAGGLETFAQQLQAGATIDKVAHALSASPEKYGKLVDALYAEYFNRAADAGGRDFWIEQLQGGTPEDLVAARLLDSVEYAGMYLTAAAFVDALYFDILGRAPDVAGRSAHLAVLAAGQPRMRIITNLIESSERAARLGRLHNLPGDVVAVSAAATANSHAQTIVTALYADILQRAPDAAGQNHFVAQLHGGAQLADVARSLLNSPEYLGKIVDEAYAAILGRAADAGGRSYWIGRLAAGMSQRELAVELVTTAEFALKHASDQAYVAALYQSLLGRSADAAGLAHHLAALADGRSRSQIARDLAGSDERTIQTVQAAYAQALGRSADAAGLAHFAARVQSGELDARGLLAALLGSNEYEFKVLGGI